MEENRCTYQQFNIYKYKYRIYKYNLTESACDKLRLLLTPPFRLPLS